MSDTIFLTIAHNIYLTREQRYSLRNPDTEINTVGLTMPVWVRGTQTSEPGDEIASRYIIRNHNNDPKELLHILNDGFVLTFTDKQVVSQIFDRKDGGCGSIYLTHNSTLRHQDRQVNVINYINIQDVTALGGLFSEKT